MVRRSLRVSWKTVSMSSGCVFEYIERGRQLQISALSRAIESVQRVRGRKFCSDLAVGGHDTSRVLQFELRQMDVLEKVTRF